jgi:ABC-type Na+ efflux pump permease subunit
LDSGYLKKTVVKEYYSDEFDFTSDLPNQVHVDNKLKAPISPSDNYPPSNTNKIKYREIIVTERGQLNKSEVRNQSTEQTAHIETRTNEKKGEFQATKTISNTKQTKKSATRVLSGVAVFLLIVFLFLFIYSRLEKVNLWQVLKSLIKL